MYLSAWARHRDARAMDDGIEQVTYQTLLRRAMALSIFIEEATGGAPGPVVVYLPAGLSVVRAALGVWFSGRAVIAVDAMAAARPAEIEAEIGSAGGAGHEEASGGGTERGRDRIFLDQASPVLGRVEPRPGLIVSIHALERQARRLREEAGLAECPVLFADDIARRMDVGHQEKIRARLERGELSRLAEIEPGRPAMIELPESAAHADIAPVALAHGEAMTRVREAVESEAAAREEAEIETAIEPRRTLAMTPPDRAVTWTAGYLPALATGGEISFIRFFYPAHVMQVARQKSVRFLLMNPSQYEALAPLVEADGLPVEVRCLVAGEPPVALVERWERLTGRRLRPVNEAVQSKPEGEM